MGRCYSGWNEEISGSILLDRDYPKTRACSILEYWSFIEDTDFQHHHVQKPLPIHTWILAFQWQLPLWSNWSWLRSTFQSQTIGWSFGTRFKSAYIPDKNISIDEELMLWKGRLAFKQYIPNKRSRFGIKFFSLCDTTRYLWNSFVYLGK